MNQKLSMYLGRQATAATLCSVMALNAALYGCAGAPDGTSHEGPADRSAGSAEPISDEAPPKAAAAGQVAPGIKPLSLNELKSQINYDRKGNAYEAKFERLANQLLLREAQSEQGFHAILEKAFGPGYDHEKAESIRQQILREDFSWAPRVEIVSDDFLHGMLGAYSVTAGTVYVSKSVPSKFERTFIYIEELGHHLDSLLNKQDAPGDEGAMFRIALTREAVAPEMMDLIRGDNHTGMIVIDGQQVQVEFLWGVDWLLGGLGAAWNGIKTGAGYIWKGATTAGSAIQTAASKSWDGATTLSGWIARGADVAADAFVSNLQRDFWSGYQAVNGAANVLISAGYGSLEGMKVLQEGVSELAKGNLVDGAAAIFTGLAKLSVEMPLDTLTTAVMESIGALQTALYLEPEGRGLTQYETDVLTWVFGAQWWLPSIRIKEGFAGIFSAISDRPFTNQFNIYLKDWAETDDLLVHESTHAWQFANGGGDYKLESIYQQYISGQGYNWEPPVDNGTQWEGLGVEQQASFVEAAHANGCYDYANYDFNLWAFTSCYINGVDRSAFFNSVDQKLWAGVGAP